MPIKSIIIGFFSLFIIMFSASSCKKGCQACDYGTTCNTSAGYCFCPNGREGDSCLLYSYPKYTSVNYIVASDPCSNYGSGYSVFFQVDGNSYNGNVLYINNLFGSQVRAEILSDANKQGVNLNIPYQVLGAFSVEGTGLYQKVANNYSRVTLQIEYVTGGQATNCTVLLNQQ